MILTRNELKEMLSQYAFNLTFTKKDGTERTMLATRMLDRIPADKQPKGEGEKAENESVLPVFDLDLGEWRSFRIDSLKTFNRTV
jgi:hypothetical protein